MPNNRRLIEEWLPIKEIGVESRRENSTGQHPPPNRLHVWWARRPLTASRAAILGALLPAWQGNDVLLQPHFADQDGYHNWFLRLLGIMGDPVAAREVQMAARARGVRLAENPFEFGRAFSYKVAEVDLKLLKHILTLYTPEADFTILDSMAGGGSIPFEALRLGFTAMATELNPVSCVVLKSTLEYPVEHGIALIGDLRHWGSIVDRDGIAALEPFFPATSDEIILDYLWARTVPCPTTGKPVPLSPNWWLRRQGDDSVAVHLLPCENDWDECRFELVRGRQADLGNRYAPDQGTVKRGSGISPWTGDPVPGDYIKRVAQEGRMGAQLYALCIDKGVGRDFRLPTSEDLAGVRRAEAALKERWQGWLAKDLIPVEEFPHDSNDQRPRTYGMDRWHKLFSPRQLLSICTYLETLKELAPQMERELGQEKAAAVRTYLALVLDKCVDYDNSLSSWDATRDKVRNTFDRHDFSFKWSFAEMNMALKDKGAFPWALDQVTDAYKGLCNLLEPSRPLFATPAESSTDKGGDRSGDAVVTRANAASLEHLEDASINAVVVDPPYGNNVMYAELSDFFYVWLKRSVGDIYPDWFRSELTDKHAEAVANPALFKGAKGSKPKEQSVRDYLLKMRRAFREMRRVVKPQGAMVVMFTHRETDMWNALGLALLETGWEVGSSWPVHTESEHSLHQARKNAARSTILLFCRPQRGSTEPSFWDQGLQQEVRTTARSKALDYQEAGVDGVDLYLATYGPVLGVLSRSWPILSADVDRETGEQKRLEPEEALSIARREVFAMRKEQLLQGRPADWDPVTEWYILAWDAARTREVSFDVAHKLGLSSGIEAADLIQRDRILARKGDTVRFLEPRERLGEGRVDPSAMSFGRLVDALHTALFIYETDGVRDCRRFLDNTGYLRDSDFQALVEASLRAIPRTRKYERGQPVGFLLPEAETLENMRLALFPDIQPPAEVGIDLGAEQGQLDLQEEDYDE